MDATRRRHAWAWCELGRARRWLGEPVSAVDEAYANAVELAPDGARFLSEWGRSTAMGAVECLSWQEPRIRGLSVPEHLYGPAVLGTAEHERQDRAVEAVGRAVDKLATVLASAIEADDHRTRPARERLADARTRIEQSGPRRMATGLEVASDLTPILVSLIGREAPPTTGREMPTALSELAKALAEVNTRFLALMGR